MRIRCLLLFGTLSAFAPVDTGAVSGATARPNRLRVGSLPSDQRSITHWFDLAAFRSAPVRVLHSGSNILPGPGFMHRRARPTAVRRRIVPCHESSALRHPEHGPRPAQAGITGTTANPERRNQLAMQVSF